MLNPSRNYLPELDIVRFWAFFAVFLFHTVYLLPPTSGSWLLRLPWFVVLITQQGGRFGVDLFFTLSAFLITSLLIAERQETGQVRLSKFYVRRILRIWPLYFGVAFLVFGLAYLLGEKELLAYFWPFVLMVPNWAWAFMGTPAVRHLPLVAIIVFWSLGIEEQFYLLWPLAMRRLRDDQLRTAGWLLIGLSAVIRFICWSSEVPHPGIYANTFARFDPIAVGILLAAEWSAMKSDAAAGLTRRLAALRSGWAMAAAVAGFLVSGYICAHQGINGTLFIFLGYPLIAWSGYLALFHTLLNLRSGRRSGRLFGLLAYLGKISYGLYIFHAFIYDLVGPVVVRALGLHADARALSAAPMALTSALSLLATILVAHLSYRYYESFFLRMKQRFSAFAAHPEREGPALAAEAHPQNP